MTWTPPPPEPASYIWLKDADHNVVSYELFIIICYEWIAWNRSIGVTDPMLIPEQWVQPGDLQNFANVVSWWPRVNVPIKLSIPTLSGMLHDLRFGAGERATVTTFAQRLDAFVRKAESAIVIKGGDPKNPNETPEERAKRKNREKQARWRLRNTASSEDPAENALIETLKSEAAKLAEWKAYLRHYVKEQKLVCDSAVRVAKQARDNNISAAEKAIVDQEARMVAAKDALSNYSAA